MIDWYYFPNLNLIKGTLQAKIEMPDLQEFTWNIYLIKNGEDNVVFFWLRKVFKSVNFSIVSYKHEMHQVTFAEKPQIKINSSYSVKALKGTVVNRALPSLHGGSLKIAFTIPVKGFNVIILPEYSLESDHSPLDRRNQEFLPQCFLILRFSGSYVLHRSFYILRSSFLHLSY